MFDRRLVERVVEDRSKEITYGFLKSLFGLPYSSWLNFSLSNNLYVEWISPGREFTIQVVETPDGPYEQLFYLDYFTFWKA